MKWIILLVLFLGHVVLGFAQSFPSRPTESGSVTEPHESFLGAVIFSNSDRRDPKKILRFQSGSTHSFCVKLHFEDSRITDFKEVLKSIEVTWKNNEFPNTIQGVLRQKRSVLKPDFEDSFCGELKIPNRTPSGSYSIIEFDLRLSSGRIVSLRDALSDFESAPEFEVEGIELPIDAPILEWVAPRSAQKNFFNSDAKRTWASVYFLLRSRKQHPAAALKNPTVLFKVFLDENWVDTVRASCPLRFGPIHHCRVEYVRPTPHLRPRKLRFELDSIFFSDTFGREYELSDPEILKKLWSERKRRVQAGAAGEAGHTKIEFCSKGCEKFNLNGKRIFH